MVFAPVLIPGVAVPLAVLGVALLLILLAAGIESWLRPVIVGMMNAIPVIGGYIADGAEAVLGFVTSGLRAAAGGLEAFASAWFSGIKIVLDELSGGLAWIAGETFNAFGAVRDVFVPGLVEAVTAPLTEGIDALGRELGLVSEEAARGIDRLGREDAAIRAEAQKGIDAVGSRVGALDDYVQGKGIDALPGMIERDLPAIEGRVGELEAEGAAVAGRVGGIEAELDRSLPWVNELATAIPAVTAIAAIEAASMARPKLGKLCLLDVSDFDDLLELALIIPSLALLTTVVRESAEGAGELLDVIGEAFR